MGISKLFEWKYQCTYTHNTVIYWKSILFLLLVRAANGYMNDNIIITRAIKNGFGR